VQIAHFHTKLTAPMWMLLLGGFTYNGTIFFITLSWILHLISVF